MSLSTSIRPGLRLRSQACDTEVIIVRVGSAPVDLRCGGVPMIAVDGATAAKVQPDPQHSGGTKLGKRYTVPPANDLEILVTKPGKGSLSDGDTPLVLKEAKPLPSSD